MRLITAARRGQQTAAHIAAAVCVAAGVAAINYAAVGVGASWEVVGCAGEGVWLRALFGRCVCCRRVQEVEDGGGVARLEMGAVGS